MLPTCTPEAQKERQSAVLSPFINKETEAPESSMSGGDGCWGPSRSCSAMLRPSRSLSTGLPHFPHQAFHKPSSLSLKFLSASLECPGAPWSTLDQEPEDWVKSQLRCVPAMRPSGISFSSLRLSFPHL